MAVPYQLANLRSIPARRPIPYTLMCAIRSINSHYFSTKKGDKLINPVVPVYVPIIGIPYDRWDDHPQFCGTFDHGTCCFQEKLNRHVDSQEEMNIEEVKMLVSSQAACASPCYRKETTRLGVPKRNGCVDLPCTVDEC